MNKQEIYNLITKTIDRYNEDEKITEDEYLDILVKIKDLTEEYSTDVLSINYHLRKELDQYKNNWEELKKWVKERYEKTEENSSRLTSKDGVPLSQDFYATVVNIQADRKDILNKMKELEKNN